MPKKNIMKNTLRLRFVRLFVAAICLFSGQWLFAQSIFENNIDFSTATPPSPYTTGQIVDPNITASGISRGPGITGASAQDRYSASNWTTSAAIDLTDYFEFTMTPNALYAINFVSFQYTGKLSGGSANYVFRSSLDGFTSNIGVANETGTTISLSAAAYQNITSAITFRYYVYGVSASTRTYSINDFIFNGTVVSTSTVDWANLQFPNTTTSVDVGTPVTYYARVYEPGVTVGAGQGANISGWIGYSSANSDPASAGWTWIAAAYNAGFADPSNDEYQAVLNLPAGVYYIASRFQLGAGTYKYGGYNAGGGGFWDGTSNISQVLIVNDANTVDWCNLQSPVSGSLVLGGVFNIYGQVYEPSLTPGAGFQGAGITAWLGYSSTNSNPNSGGWTWVPMNFNAFGGGDDNDEYMQDIGSYLTLPGTYYYATRYQLGSGSYRYGGILSSGVNGSFWDGVNYISGVLTVTSPPSQEINLKGLTGGTNSITSGSVTASGLNNTLFASTTVGSFATKDYKIENTGTATLNLTGIPRVSIGGVNPGDFAVTTMPATGTVAPGANTTFIITFTPTAVGTRTAIVSIANNDTNENPYTFLIQGNGNCPAAANILTPASGPAGTEITVAASANNLTGATATFDGTAVSVTPVDATHIKITVPAGAISGDLVTTNSSGCTASNYFPVIQSVIGSCAGGSSASDLFISEVTDATLGGLSYIEIYNGTGNPVNLGDYGIRVFSNGQSTYSSSVDLNNVVLNSGSIYIVALGAASSPDNTNTCTAVTGGNGELANQSSTAPGINFNTGGNDHIALVNISTNTKVDSFGTYLSDNWADALGLSDRGAVFRRKNTATLPSVVYSNSDWVITNWPGTGYSSCGTNDYSDIGSYVFVPAIPPTVTLHPVYSPSCKATSFTVAGTEGVAGNPALAYQWYYAAPNTANWTAVSNGGVYSGATSATLSISNIAGLDGYQFYCQIRENSATCFSASNAVKITEAGTVTWNGSSWSPGAPTIGSIAVINGSYDTNLNGNIDACSLIVNSPATLTIASADYVNIQNDLTVSPGASLQVQDSGSLVMIDDAGVVTNNGTMQVTRTTAPYRKFDYTYWSSPVANAQIGATFTGWRTDYAFDFATVNFEDLLTAATGLAPADGFDDDNNDWHQVTAATVMTAAKGYAIMAPTNVAFSPTAVSTVTFNGAVNNGVFTIPLAQSQDAVTGNDDFNLIGNPYPSALSGDAFLTQNTIVSNQISGALYFWTHNEPISNAAPGPSQYNFVTDDYAMYTLSGGTASGTGSLPPTGKIASGEGFFVDAANGATVATFNNAMRDKAFSNSQFFRSSSQPNGQIDRIWLNFTHANGLFSQQLIAYFPNTTLGFDAGYDGQVNLTQNSVSFYSFIDSDSYRIQARPSFDDNDIVPLGYKVLAAGHYNIAIAQSEGVFADQYANVYLEDKLLNVFHNLKDSSYGFDTEAGTFDKRFQLRYNDAALSNPDFDVAASSVIVTASNGQIKIRSYGGAIASTAVYDIAGRVVYAKAGISAQEFHIDEIIANHQALIVKVTLGNGTVVNRKVIF